MRAPLLFLYAIITHTFPSPSIRAKMNPFFRPRDARLRRRQRIPLSLPRSLHGHGKGGGEEVEEPAEKRSILEPILLDRSLSFDEKMRKVDEYFALRPGKVAKRLAELLSAVTKVTAAWKIDATEDSPASSVPPRCAFENEIEECQNIAERKRGRILRETIGQNGVLFIKLAQTAATRPDLIGDEAALALEKLQDRTQPFDDKIAKKILQEELGKGIFSEITNSPIAAASLAQVYKAKLKETGETVAVKIRRPNLVDQVALDSYLCRLVLRTYTRIFATAERDYEILFKEVGSGLLEELDFTQEAVNAKDFTEAHKHIRFLRVPQPFDKYVTPRVLTLEWVDGRKLTELPAYEQREMVKMGIDVCFSQLLSTGIVHADPHYGNMLYDNDGKLVLLDFGLVTRVTQAQKEAMAGSIVHTLDEDWEGLIEDYRELGLLPTQPAIWADKDGNPQDGLGQGYWKPVSKETFISAFKKSLEEDPNPSKNEKSKNSQKVAGGGGTPMKEGGGTNMIEGGGVPEAKRKKKRTFSEITTRLTELSFQYRFTLPEWMLFIIRSVITLDGFAGRMEPPFNALELAYPHAIRRALTPRTKKGQQELRNLVLTHDGDLNLERLSSLLGENMDRRSPSEDTWPETTSPVTTSSGKKKPGGGVMNGIPDGGMGNFDVMDLLASPDGCAIRRILFTLNTQRLLGRVLGLISPFRDPKTSTELDNQLRALALQTLRRQFFPKLSEIHGDFPETHGDFLQSESRDSPDTIAPTRSGAATVGAMSAMGGSGGGGWGGEDRDKSRRLKKVIGVIKRAHLRRCLTSPKALGSALAIGGIISLSVLRDILHHTLYKVRVSLQRTFSVFKHRKRPNSNFLMTATPG
ncbi:hypothetical protein AAMO2058_001022700 [Amorphochlora amoebiformis]